MSSTLTLPFSGTSDDRRPDVPGFQINDPTGGTGIEGITSGFSPLPGVVQTSIGVRGICRAVPSPIVNPLLPPTQFFGIGVLGNAPENANCIGVQGEGGIGVHGSSARSD